MIYFYFHSDLNRAEHSVNKIRRRIMRSAASDLGLHCLPMTPQKLMLCLYTYMC